MLDKAKTIIKGDVEVDGDFIEGDKHTIEKLIVHIYGEHASPKYSEDALNDQLGEYRRYLIETYKYLDFKGIEGIADTVKDRSGLMLESVYVPLRARSDTPDAESWHRLAGRYYCGAKAVPEADAEKAESEMLRAESAALPVEQWIKDQQALVILGDPGSGKSTSMKRLALGLAQQDNAPLPILLPLNAYSKALEQGNISFEDFLAEYFHAKRTQLECKKLTTLFKEALEQQRAVILIDGLDEVGDNRGMVVEQVENFVRAWIPDPQNDTKSGNRMVITSRFVGYRDYPLKDPRWSTVALSDWNSEEILRFFRLFTLASELAISAGENEEQAKIDAEDEWRSLEHVINNNVGIRRLSGNPLLASLLALIKRQDVTLPNRRVELYDLYMGTLLRSWNRSRNLDSLPIGPEIDFSPTQLLLAKLALHLRENNPQGGLIREVVMRKFLVDHFREDDYTRSESEEKAKGFLESVHKYSSLLIEKGREQYGFIHLTFEEYLAGFGLAAEREGVLCKRIPELLLQEDHWRESLLLALGVMSVVNSDPAKANAILDTLLDSEEATQVLFSADVLHDVGTAVLGNKTTQKIRRKLEALMSLQEVSIESRARAGRLLSRIGDLRTGVTVKKINSAPLLMERGEYSHAVPDIDWVKISAGTFQMGTEGEEGYGDEKPVHEVIVGDFHMSRYCVTNSQYRCFVEAGMYEDKAFWEQLLPESASLWLGGTEADDSLLETFSDEDFRERYRKFLNSDVARLEPRFWESERWGLDNHPVVGVSWYEALAYSVWLNHELKSQTKPKGMPSDCIIRLPAEDEWEYAARGVHNLRYAWGNGESSSLCNMKESGLQRTTAVGLYEKGDAIDGDGMQLGLYDMSGNVWEWTQSRWGASADNPEFVYEEWLSQNAVRNDLDANDFKITRGGSWFYTSDYCRSAIRDRFLPDLRDYALGFRLVCL